MDRDYENTYALIEESHPWFVARRELFAALVAGRTANRILDVGCGTGMFLVHLKGLGFEHLAGVEPSPNLRERFRDRTITLHEELPDVPADVVFMLDVLEHIEDDRKTLAGIHQLLEPGGACFLSVPAHPFLWSDHDERNEHKRRYSRRELREKLIAAGFRVHRISYWNLCGFLPLLVIRLLRLSAGSNELELGSPLSMWTYRMLLRLENSVVKRVDLPFGVSLIAVAEKTH